MAASSTILTITGLDSGSVDTASTSVKTGSNTVFTIYIKQASGTITNAVIMLQCSHDNDAWFKTTETITMSNTNNRAFSIGPIAADYMRVMVSTASSGASTADIIIQAKAG